MLFGGGYLFETPIPEVTPEGIKPYPPTGARKHDLRTLFFYGYTGITPAMAMRLTGLGSQYLVAFFDSNKEYFDGAKSYKVTLPPNPPEARFWSFTLYDNQTRSMLVTPQRFPRAGSQSYPSPGRGRERRRFDHRPLRARAAGGVADGNWIQTTPGKGFFPVLRLYSPLQPFFDKSWRVGEVEPT